MRLCAVAAVKAAVQQAAVAPFTFWAIDTHEREDSFGFRGTNEGPTSPTVEAIGDATARAAGARVNSFVDYT